MALLRLILHDLESRVQLSVALRELKGAQRRLENLEAEHARLRRELHRRVPGIPEQKALGGAGTHSEQIVQRMLDYIHAHYHRPLQLRDVATVLNMNACYLSTLFANTLGMAFHQYLDQIRLARAKELLRDPAYRSCEVACAIGCASARQFWRFFKAHTGLSPCLWRDCAGQPWEHTR